jgi:DNA-binding response OmpR family regulator
MSKEKILVVEDDGMMREYVALFLRSAGYSVDTAEDGMAAVRAVRRNAPALIISDVTMPRLNGFEFIATLREDAGVRNIPVIFLTSVPDGEKRSEELGALAYMRKPMKADKLLSLVAATIPGQTDNSG